MTYADCALDNSMASRKRDCVYLAEVSIEERKREKISHRDNPATFYYFFEVIACFFALNAFHFSFSIILFFLLGLQSSPCQHLLL